MPADTSPASPTSAGLPPRRAVSAHLHARQKVAGVNLVQFFCQQHEQEAAELLGIDQSKVSRITRGQFRGVSEGKMLELVTKQIRREIRAERKIACG